jgi:hypothetical protein
LHNVDAYKRLFICHCSNTLISLLVATEGAKSFIPNLLKHFFF